MNESLLTWSSSFQRFLQFLSLWSFFLRHSPSKMGANGRWLLSPVLFFLLHFHCHYYFVFSQISFSKKFPYPVPFKSEKACTFKVSELLTMESPKPILDFEKFDNGFVQKLVYDALVWSSLHGLVVGDKTYQVSQSSQSSCLLMLGSTFEAKVKIFESL